MIPIDLKLTRDEALVLNEFLRRRDEEGGHAIVDRAEERALWNLQCLLERELWELFDPNYGN